MSPTKTNGSSPEKQEIHRKLLGSPAWPRVSAMLANHDVPRNLAHVVRVELQTILVLPRGKKCLEISIESLLLAEKHLDSPTLLGDVLSLLSDKDTPMARHLTRGLFSFNATMARCAWTDTDRHRMRKFWCVILLAVWYDAIQARELFIGKRLNRRDIRRQAAAAFYA